MNEKIGDGGGTRGPLEHVERCVPLDESGGKPDWYYPETDPNIYLNTHCNIDCVFCSSVNEYRLTSDDDIRRLILANKHTISFEGGEPTLSKDLPKWVRFAKENGVRETVLCTNAAVFENTDRIEELVTAGLDVFNVNFPAHIDRLYDAITQTRGYFHRRVKAVKNLIETAGGAKVRLHVVVNKFNYKIMPDYARFVREEFPGIFFVEFNIVKVLGYVKQRKFLVPTLTDMEPYLLESWARLRRCGIRFMTDGFPLCATPGFEEDSIDAWKLARLERRYINEKAQTPRCTGCTLVELCPGPRRDYVLLHGDGELRPSRKSADALRRRLLRDG
ncbi:MAG: radical SAM protein [Elusimicrobia bacterium]|nr:radical SAM protein [Elusimicrobiota bacterium]